MALFLAIVGVLVLGVPIAFTFLNLAGKIGPENSEDAFWLGVLLWVVGMGVCAGFIENAMKLVGR